MQGITLMSIAGFSDTAGRRPAYIICFTILPSRKPRPTPTKQLRRARHPALCLKRW